MNVKFEIQEERVQNLSDNAKYELEKLSKKYAEEILDEASRIEETSRNQDAKPEITTSILKDADYYRKRFCIKRKKSKQIKIIQIINFVSNLISGFLFSLLLNDKFKEINCIILFLITFFVSIGTFVYLTFNDDNNG